MLQGRALVAATVAAGLGSAASSAALLRLQADQARRRVVPLVPTPPAGCDRLGPDDAERLRLALLGDSAALGVGATSFQTSPAGLLAAAVAARGRSVSIEVHARSGARTAALAEQVTALLATPERREEQFVVVIITGANDILGRVPPLTVSRQLFAAVSRLHAAGAQVVVGTAPDVHGVPAAPPALRRVGHVLGQHIASAQGRAVRAAGGREVALGRLVGPAFTADSPLFGVDGFHPSDAGYRVITEAMLPAVLAAAGLSRAEPGLASRPNPVLSKR